MGLTQSREPSPQVGQRRWLFLRKLVEKRVPKRQKQLLGLNSVLSCHVGSISPSSSSLLPSPFSEYAPLHRGAIQAMATEIERKFLVISDEWRNHMTESIPIAQGYIQAREDRAVRVRLKGGPGSPHDKSRAFLGRTTRIRIRNTDFLTQSSSLLSLYRRRGHKDETPCTGFRRIVLGN